MNYNYCIIYIYGVYIYYIHKYAITRCRSLKEVKGRRCIASQGTIRVIFESSYGNMWAHKIFQPKVQIRSWLLISIYKSRMTGCIINVLCYLHSPTCTKNESIYNSKELPPTRPMATLIVFQKLYLWALYLYNTEWFLDIFFITDWAQLRYVTL